MADTVKVPLLGTHKKGTVIGVTIGGVVVAGYLIWRNQKKAADQAQQTQEAQASASYGYGASPQGFYGYGEPGLGYGYGFPGFPRGGPGHWDNDEGSETGTGTTTTISTNAQWTAAALTQLRQDGYQAQAVLTALGRYLNGVAVTPDQVNIVRSAIALEGYPPVSGKNGFPPGIKETHGGQPGQGKDRDVIEAPGHENLVQIGAHHQASRVEMDRLNPSLFRRYGNKKDIPQGTKVRIP